MRLSGVARFGVRVFVFVVLRAGGAVFVVVVSVLAAFGVVVLGRFVGRGMRGIGDGGRTVVLSGGRRALRPGDEGGREADEKMGVHALKSGLR